MQFLRYCIFGVFVRFWGFSGDLCILRVLVSYEVTRGIILVVGRVHDGFGGFKGVLGVQLANFNWVGITAPFLAHGEPSWGGPEGYFLSKLSPFRTLKSLKIPCIDKSYL